MNRKLLSQLSTQLWVFDNLEITDPTQTITDAYYNILGTVQAILLEDNNSDAHARAWTLLNDDAYKDVSAIEEGRKKLLAGLKLKIAQVGKLLLNSDRHGLA
ncbi:hypothetical protein GCM10028807_51900 [Spirosoma daeguense]